MSPQLRGPRPRGAVFTQTPPTPALAPPPIPHLNPQSSAPAPSASVSPDLVIAAHPPLSLVLACPQSVTWMPNAAVMTHLICYLSILGPASPGFVSCKLCTLLMASGPGTDEH